MEELRMALDLLLSEGLSEIIISNPRQKEGTVKVKIRPVLLKEQLMFQVTRFRGKQVFHENLDREKASCPCEQKRENDSKMDWKADKNAAGNSSAGSFP